MEEFNWEQLAWTSPILVAICAGLFALFKAFADKRTDPLDRMEKVLNTYQKSAEEFEAQALRARKREKATFKMLMDERTYSTQWEQWHAAGMPDPPGRPVRPPKDDELSDPPTGSLSFI